MDEVFSHTFKAMRQRLDERRAEGRRLWQQRLGTASEFCRAVVSNGYLSEEQMQRAVQRYRLGASRDGGVIFWQIDEFDQLRDGKIMHYPPTVTATTTASRHGRPTCCASMANCRRIGTPTTACSDYICFPCQSGSFPS